MKIQIALGALLLAMPVSTALADAFSDAQQSLCDKIKSCALEQMEGEQDMDEPTRTMIMNSLGNMCVGMNQGFSVATRAHELYEPATACMNSMAQLSCEALMDDRDEKSQECAAFREQAREYE